MMYRFRTTSFSDNLIKMNDLTARYELPYRREIKIDSATLQPYQSFILNPIFRLSTANPGVIHYIDIPPRDPDQKAGVVPQLSNSHRSACQRLAILQDFSSCGKKSGDQIRHLQ